MDEELKDGVPAEGEAAVASEPAVDAPVEAPAEEAAPAEEVPGEGAAE